MRIVSLFCKIDDFFGHTKHILHPDRFRTVNPLKTQIVLEHSRHRSFVNFRVDVVSTLIACQIFESEPSVAFSEL